MKAPVAREAPAYDSWEGHVRFWEETDWPEGCKAEIIEGTVRVTPPAMNHQASPGGGSRRWCLSGPPGR
ncbi:hypothetical protein [Streptomyces erythrochromogenes]|uniref:hypothetical protein n=1 Tax=Streptomyces erythrochromogenes TaxID=285574 RepID=UPI0037F4BAB9